MNEAVVRDVNRIPDVVRELKFLTAHEVTAGLHADIVPEKTMIAATVNEFGAKIKKTPKMRRWLGAMARKYNIILRASGTDPDFVVIPPRPFVRSAAAERANEIMGVATEMTRRVIEGQATGQDAANAIGLKMEQAIKDQINRVTGPPLHPLTVAMKKSDKPLINKGTMRRAIRYMVKKRGQ